MKGTTQTRTQLKMVSVGQPKHHTILKERGDIHIMGNKEYGVWSTKLSRKQAPLNHYWTVRPKLSLLMYNVYANIRHFGLCFCFFAFLLFAACFF